MLNCGNTFSCFAMARVDGDISNSLTRNAVAPMVERVWGGFRVLVSITAMTAGVVDGGVAGVDNSGKRRFHFLIVWATRRICKGEAQPWSRGVGDSHLFSRALAGASESFMSPCAGK